MRILTLEQGSPEWVQARLGIPTASQFHRILTPAKLQYAAAAPKYHAELLAEWIAGHPLEFGSGGGSGYTVRGTEMEDEARRWYEAEHDVDVQRVGFIMRDDGEAGGSPDGFIDDDGVWEGKCPALHTHLQYLENSLLLEDEYRSQVMGYLYLSDRAYADLVAYHPELPKVVRRIERDEKYIAALDSALDNFVAVLNASKKKFAQYRMPTRDEAMAGAA